MFEVKEGEDNGSPAVDLALGLEGELVGASVGYGEPVPYKGTNKPEELLKLYWGTSLSMRPSGTCKSTCEVILGERAGTLCASELFDRADEDRGRELVIVIRASSSSRPAVSKVGDARRPLLVVPVLQRTKEGRALSSRYRCCRNSQGTRLPVKQQALLR